MTGATANQQDALGRTLLASLRRSARLPEWLDATVVLRAGVDAAFTLRIAGGRPALAWDADPSPDTTVTADPDTLRRIAEGELSGVDAFLDGLLTVRGNLALALRLAGNWPAGGATFPRSRDLTVGGLRTFYLEAGEGPPVVLLHGLGATNASMLTTMRALCSEHRVLAPDLPGFGDSDRPLRPLHAAFYSRWLSDFLDGTGIRRAHLVGNSMGGRVAIELALRHPDRVDRIALLAPSPAFLRNREYVRLVRLLRPELAAIPLPMPRRYVLRTIRGMFARPERLDASWYDAAADEFLRVFDTVRGRISFFSAARQIYLEEPYTGPGRFWARLPELTRPALFLWGERDRLVPAGFASHVEEALPTTTSVVLEDCGHVPQYELPERTHDLVRGFLHGEA